MLTYTKKYTVYIIGISTDLTLLYGAGNIFSIPNTSLHVHVDSGVVFVHLTVASQGQGSFECYASADCRGSVDNSTTRAGDCCADVGLSYRTSGGPCTNCFSRLPHDVRMSVLKTFSFFSMLFFIILCHVL